MPFWRISFALLARHLCHLFCYQVSCISANIIVVLILKGQEILFQSFLVRLGENFLEFCFQLVYFFLDGKDNNNKKNLITVHPPSLPPANNYLELKSIVLKHAYTMFKVFCKANCHMFDRK